MMRCRNLRVVAGACGLMLCSCNAIEHGPEVHQARQRVTEATGRDPAWQVDMPVKPLAIPAGGELSEDAAIALALTNNRALRADLTVIGQAKAELVQAGLLPNPTLSIMFGFPEAGGLSNLAFGLSQDLAALWLIPAEKKAAQAALEQRVLSVADVAVALVAEVRTSYANAQYQRLAAQLQEENLRILTDATEIAEARLGAGGLQLDLNLVRSRSVEADIELLQLRSDYRVTQRTLLRLMGVAYAPDDWIPSAMNLEQTFARLSSDEGKLVEAALLQRLDAQAAWWELEVAVADIENQRARLLPSLELGIAGERFERRALPDRDLLADAARASLAAGQLSAPMIESAGQRRKERSQEIEFILGPSLDIPLPIFDQNQAKIARARARAKELRERYEEMQQRIVEAVRSAVATRCLAEERVARYRDGLLPLQRSNLELAEAAYQAGQESILAVLLAQESLIRARLGYAAALRDVAVSAANLERQFSGQVPDFLQAPQPSSAPASGPTTGIERHDAAGNFLRKVKPQEEPR
jgi:outer membrane protein, heavy metal efflux system